MKLKELTIEDCQAVANLHEIAFKSFFLTSLGNKFLKTFYKSIIHHPNGIAIGLFEEKRLIAFAVGTYKKNGFYADIIKKSGLYLLASTIPQLVFRPAILYKLFKAFSTNESDNSIITGAACLLSICVDPVIANKGYGKRILTAFEQKVSFKSKTLILTTDAKNNDTVNKFYLGNNYILLNEFYQSDRRMNLYYKSL